MAAGGLWNRAQSFWGRTPTWGKVAIGAIGGLLGLRIGKSLLFGDEPMGPAMRIPPEVAARAQLGDMYSGAPLPPTPIMGPGIHTDTMPRPTVPFSPPPARVTSPLSSGPSVMIDAESNFGASVQVIGRQFQRSLNAAEGPIATGVISSDAHGHSQRLTRLNDASDREMSRFYT